MRHLPPKYSRRAGTVVKGLSMIRNCKDERFCTQHTPYTNLWACSPRLTLPRYENRYAYLYPRRVCEPTYPRLQKTFGFDHWPLRTLRGNVGREGLPGASAMSREPLLAACRSTRETTDLVIDVDPGFLTRGNLTQGSQENGSRTQTTWMSYNRWQGPMQAR
jgi:hypothetical protein